MPGINGDNTTLALIRAELRARLRFVTIKYPSPSEMFEADARFDAVADAAVAQIRRLAKHSEIIHLAGYSFGGFVAWEVARRLRAAGYRIGAIALIDTRRARLVANLKRRKLSSRVSSAMQKILLRPRQSADTILYWTKYSVYTRLPLNMLRILHGWTMRFPSLAARLPESCDNELRRRALNDFRPSRLNHPTTLFRSTDYIEEFPDHGWSDVCPQLTIVPIDGTHSSMLASPCRAVLLERLFETVATAEAALHRQRPYRAGLPGTAA
jgi:thioesterase domain-containing protein